MKFVPVGAVLFGVWHTRVLDFREFVRNTGYDATIGDFYSWNTNEQKWKVQGHTWMDPSYKQGPTHPVVGITWEDAVAFCQWLTNKERKEGYLTLKQSYRLPSDKEWSQAVGPTKYPWGDEWPPTPQAGNYAVNQLHEAASLPALNSSASQEDLYRGTTPVESFPPNQFGIFDMGGNAWEWCSDWYKKEMNSSELRNMYDFLNDDGGGTLYQFLRGASWFNKNPHELLSGYRNPGKYPSARFSNVSFRCVLDINPTPLLEEEFHL